MSDPIDIGGVTYDGPSRHEKHVCGQHLTPLVRYLTLVYEV